MVIPKERMLELLEKNNVNEKNGFPVETRGGGINDEFISYIVSSSCDLYICMFTDGEIYFSSNGPYPNISKLANDVVIENGENRTNVDLVVSYFFEKDNMIMVKNDLDLEKIKKNKKIKVFRIGES